MKNTITILFTILIIISEANAQVIYERTYSQISPSIRQTIQLSDTSSICFSSVSECQFGPFHHIDQYGNIINSIGFTLESTHSSGARTIGVDSILVWNRDGPTDSEGPNYLRIGLWTPTQFVILVSDSLHYQFWEDKEVHYEAYLFKDDKLVYRKADSLYVVEISTQQLLRKVVVPELGDVNAFLDYIVAFPASADPIIFSIDLLPVDTWHFNQHPVNHYIQIALDSFLIGHITQEAASLHVVNGLTEVNFDLDLSDYLTHIDDIQVNEQGLFVKGKRGALDYMIQINAHLQVINETVMDMPEFAGLFTFTYYSYRVYGSRTDGVAEYRMSYRYADANPIRFVDVSLDTIWVDSVFYWPHEMHLPANLYCLARVTNHSADTIHYLTFHYEEMPFFFCDPGVYPFFINGLSIPPEETGTVPFTTWSWEVAEHNPFFRTYYVEHANHHLDDQIADNHFQLTYLLSVVNPVTENNLSIWPNPFYDYLETSSDFESLKMYNNLGYVVSTGINRLDNLRNLAPGTYYVQGLRDQKSFFTRVIKID